MRQKLIFLLAVFMLSSCAADETLNQPLPYSISEAIAMQDYRARLKGFRFYFGNQRHPAVGKTIGVRATAQRSSAAKRERKESCAHAFVSALLRLRSEALASGGNAIINIKSNYGNFEVSSEGSYQCASSALMSGVALRGTVVKLRN